MTLRRNLGPKEVITNEYEQSFVCVKEVGIRTVLCTEKL